MSLHKTKQKSDWKFLQPTIPMDEHKNSQKVKLAVFISHFATGEVRADWDLVISIVGRQKTQK